MNATRRLGRRMPLDEAQNGGFPVKDTRYRSDWCRIEYVNDDEVRIIVAPGSAERTVLKYSAAQVEELIARGVITHRPQED